MLSFDWSLSSGSNGHLPAISPCPFLAHSSENHSRAGVGANPTDSESGSENISQRKTGVLYQENGKDEVTETTDVYTEVSIGPGSLGSPISTDPEKGLRKTQVCRGSQYTAQLRGSDRSSQRKGNRYWKEIIITGCLMPYQDLYMCGLV